MMFKNRSEEFVYNIAHRSFLSLWSYANPLKEPGGKELCDVLTAFGSNVAIFSVKETELRSESPLDLERWTRRAIEGSVKQIYGAERSIRAATHIVRSDGSQGLPLPAQSEMQIHRIAVALGSGGKVPISSRDFGKGFVHVFDDTSFFAILGELDTAPDLFTYLSEKVSFLTSTPYVLLDGGEEDLLAVYLTDNRRFPSVTSYISIRSGVWDDFQRRPEYIAKKRADKSSVIWDGLIETVARAALAGTLEFGSTLSDTELALRQMAAEDRYQRRLLGQAFDDFLQQSAKRVRSRLVTSPAGVTYVFLAKPLGTKREDRGTELFARCFVARGKFRDCPKVVGIATEEYIPNQGFSLDLVYISKPEWTDEDQKAFEEIQLHETYFKRPLQPFGQDEYPSKS
jgi:hypothetical protein